jgi:hypothetical protein
MTTKRHPLYATWCGMIQRCEYAKAAGYARYGGRGIRVCDRWRHDFAAFLADMGPRPTPRHTVDRVDNDGNYEPGNCRWATRTEQRNNIPGRLVWLTLNGETHTVTEWARLRGIDSFTLFRRVYRGWTPERALVTPTLNRGQKRRNEVSP